MSQRNLAWLLIVPGIVLLLAVVSAKTPPPDKDYKMVRQIVDVLAEVDRSYYRTLTDEQKKRLVEDMINGGLQKLDPYSEYFNEEDLKGFKSQTEGQFGGIGAYLGVDPNTNQLMVESPMIGTPAYEAGLQAGDLIIKVNDTPTKGLRGDEARNLIKGKEGTAVKLTIQSPGVKERDVTITRAIIDISPIMGVERKADDLKKWNYIADNESKIALIRLTAFNEKSTKELTEAIKDAENAGAKALILDMRGNPGGLLTEAVKISNLFISEGAIVSTKDRNKIEEKSNADPKKMIYGPANKKPMAVLVDGNSASAAEIVAAALQDHERAVIVGQRTYGKGSVQQVHYFNNETSALKLTGKVWLTPKGRNIHRWPDSKDSDEWGVMPNPGLEVKLTPQEYIQTQLLLEKVQLGKVRERKDRPEIPPLDPKFKDPVVEKALEHLRKKIGEVGLGKLDLPA
jgi:carboxyl-terminal processing protease